MKFKKLLCIVFVCLFITGCNSNSNLSKSNIKVLVPMGAPAVGTLGWENNNDIRIDYVDGSEKISAELLKKNSQYDVIVAPINLGCTLQAKGNDYFYLDSILSWGNLYIVGSADFSKVDTLAAFGEGSVPQLIVDNLKERILKEKNIVYYPNANDVMAQMLTGKTKLGLLAEPMLSTAIIKGKKAGLDIQIFSDLQAEYSIQNENERRGYPQSALFIKNESAKVVAKKKQLLSDFISHAKDEENKKLFTIIDEVGTKKLGVPEKELVAAAWDRMNLSLVDAKDAKEDISELLALFKIEFNDSMIKVK